MLEIFGELVPTVGGVDKYMAVCRECYKLRFLKKSTPFKNMEENNRLGVSIQLDAVKKDCFND